MYFNIGIVSIDFACTVFWEPACDPHAWKHGRENVFKAINSFLEEQGYSIMGYLSYEEIYRSIWKEISSRRQGYELWHHYVLAHYLRRIGVNPSHKILNKVYKLYIELSAKLYTLPPLHRWVLKNLKGRGYLVVLTTATGSHDLILRVLEENTATNLFDYVHSTQLVGIPKTDPQFYRELAELLEIEPYRIIHIGDATKYDIEPARKAGLKTIYYGWRTQCRATDPQPCITSLYELLNML